MKRLAALVAAFTLIFATPVFADENLPGVGIPELQRVTCYNYNSGITYSGTVPKMGRTCGGKKENVGKAAVLYSMNPDGSIGDFVGVFLIEDTGSAKRIEEGSIDIFRDSMDLCNEWIRTYGDYMYVQIVEGQG